MLSSLTAALSGFKSNIEAAAARYQSRDTAEAIIAIATGTAFADGQMEEAEQKKLAAMIRTLPMLQRFPQHELVAKHTELKSLCEMDVDMGHDACLKELQDVVGRNAPREERILIMRAGVMLAKADAEGMEDQEKDFLTRCAVALGIATTDVGL